MLSSVCFYVLLKFQIENSNSWNNPFILTTQLNGILSYRISNSSFLFKVHVKTRESIRDVSVASTIFCLIRIDIVVPSGLHTHIQGQSDQYFRLRWSGTNNLILLFQVIRAIDQLSLSYVGNEHLYNVITDGCIQKYNKGMPL